MRREYEMTDAELQMLLDACEPVPYLVVGGMEPRSPRDKANDVWAALGRTHGFEWRTVRPVSGKGDRFFTAEPMEVKP